VVDVIETSKRKGVISLSDEKFEVLQALYAFSVKKIYNHPEIQSYKDCSSRIIERLFEHLMKLIGTHGWDFERYQRSALLFERMFGNYLNKMTKIYEAENASNMHIIRDYIAGMTDGFAISCMEDISLPKPLCFNRSRPSE
jgi:dGTPase